jgi:hypothetical protein
MDALSKAIENRRAPFEVGSRSANRGRVVSFRVTEAMENKLEKQAGEWELSLSDTVRRIMVFYFLPALLQEVLNQKVQVLEELVSEEFPEKKADTTAPTKAQEIEPLLLDAEEAEEYAKFLYELNEENMKHYQVIRDEAVLMHKIASRKLLEQARALEQAKLPNIEEVQRV